MSKSFRILTLVLLAITAIATGLVIYADVGSKDEQSSDTAASTAVTATTMANTENPPATPADQAPEGEDQGEGETPPAEEPESPVPLAFAASIDGQDFTIPDPRVECSQDPTFTQVAVSSADPANKNNAAFQIDGEQRVVSVSMSDGSPVTLTVESMTGEGKAEGEINGGHYKVWGEGWNIDYSNPGDHEVKPFTMEVTCP